jgi:hypothetical protein
MRRTYRVSYSYTASGSLDVLADSPEEAESIVRGLDNADDRWQLEIAAGMGALRTDEPVEVVLEVVDHVLEYGRDPREVFAMRYLEGRGFTVLLPPGCAMGTAVGEPRCDEGGGRAQEPPPAPARPQATRPKHRLGCPVAEGPAMPPDGAARALPLERVLPPPPASAGRRRGF